MTEDRDPLVVTLALTTMDLAQDAGRSECPLCGRSWLVTPLDDCFMPACGHYGYDHSEANMSRPCQRCGLRHAWTCRAVSAPVEEG